MPFNEKISLLHVPDDDAINWIDTLRNGGLDENEVDLIMAHLNKTYREMRPETLVEYCLAEVCINLEKAGHNLTEKDKSLLRTGIMKKYKLNK